MRKLMSANLFRLWRSRVFWICAAAVFLLGAWWYLDAWKFMRETGFDRELTDQTFTQLPFSCIITAVFCGMFLGGEFSFGTIRNKLAAGHTRTSIYLAALLSCICAGLLLCLSYAAAVVLVGMPLLGFFRVNMTAVLYYAFCMICVICVFTAIMVLLVTKCASRTVGVVLGILLMLGMLFVSAQIERRLSEPEMNVAYTVIDSETYRPLEVEEQPNPLYLSGTKREIYQWLHDILPAGQSIQISNLGGPHPIRWPFASAAEFLLLTVLGVYLFCRKDLN